MDIKGHGIDIVEIERFAELCKNQRYVQRCFTANEQAQSRAHPERLAARFAAKEAVLKALHLGIVDGVSLKDVEVRFSRDGAPQVGLYGVVAQTAKNNGITQWHISFSHGHSFAIASAIGCGP